MKFWFFFFTRTFTNWNVERWSRRVERRKHRWRAIAASMCAERYMVLGRWTLESGQLANIQIKGLPREFCWKSIISCSWRCMEFEFIIQKV